MYNVSEQFHTAVFENSPTTQVLFRFSDGTIFTNEDVHLASGIKVMEAANYEEELTIGSCLSSTLSATFMNYHGLLSGFAFGECEVSLGVKTGTDTFTPTVANVTAIHGTTVYTGHSTAPYLKANGSAMASQPTFPVHAIVIYEGELLCIGSDGSTWTSAGFTEPISASDFMTAKYVAMAKSHLGYDFTGDVLRIYSEYGTTEIYEYAKLGVFKIDTPKKRNTNLIAVTTAYDKMRLFDISLNDFLIGLTYPITLGAIFEALCTAVGVDYVTSTFTNSTHSVASVSLEETEITAKDILKWIAEAAGSFARMTRDGKVELGWFADADIEIPETQCFKADIADYAVAEIDKLEILSSETSLNAVVGTGTNSYVIINNPFLHGVTPGDVEEYGQPIYDKLAAFPAFYPLAVTAVCDWSIQAGDIISVEHDGVYYDLPVYCQTIVWKGDAKVSYESTGSATRPVIDATTRELYRVQAGVEAAVKQGEAYNEVVITHTDGVVVSADIDGKTITVKMNGADGFALYEGETYLGGIKVVEDQAALLSNILSNATDNTCYARIEETTIDGYTYKGIYVFDTSLSESSPSMMFLIGHTSGSIIMRGINSFPRFQIASSAVSMWYDSNNAMGVDSGGAWKLVGGSKTYL